MHLTYHDSKRHTSEASTAKAEGAGAPETEFTFLKDEEASFRFKRIGED